MVTWSWLTKGEREGATVGLVFFIGGIAGIIAASTNLWLPGMAAGVGVGVIATIYGYALDRLDRARNDALRAAAELSERRER